MLHSWNSCEQLYANFCWHLSHRAKALHDKAIKAWMNFHYWLLMKYQRGHAVCQTEFLPNQLLCLKYQRHFFWTMKWNFGGHFQSHARQWNGLSFTVHKYGKQSKWFFFFNNPHNIFLEFLKLSLSKCMCISFPEVQILLCGDLCFTIYLWTPLYGVLQLMLHIYERTSKPFERNCKMLLTIGLEHS